MLPMKESELGENSNWRRSGFAQIMIIQGRRSPKAIETHQGFVHIKSVRVEWDGVPGKGQRANRNALAPSPGFGAVKEWCF